ncbi:MAG TPA: 6,7-dimethyl-8-ribityllumazine synthase [Acidimicrobiia bacterium]
MRLREVAGDLDGRGLHIGVAASTFNAVITEGLVAGALRALEAMGVEQVTVLQVAGALEVPLAARRLVDTGCDAVVAIGAVIRGETDHYRHVATESAAGLRSVSLETGIPVTNAILTVREFEQARDRSQPGPGNKGYEAAEAAVATVKALRALRVD